MIPFHDWYLLRAVLLFGALGAFAIFSYMTSVRGERSAQRMPSQEAPQPRKAPVVGSGHVHAAERQPAGPEATAVRSPERRAA